MYKLKVVTGILLLSLFGAGSCLAQSGMHRSPGYSGGLGVNLTFSIFQFDAANSPAMDQIRRLPQSFVTPQEEAAYLKANQKLEGVALRHSRQVGLSSGESFSDAVLLGPEYMLIKVTPLQIEPGHLKLNVGIRYANNPLLDSKGVDLTSFETVLLLGGKGMFGVKYFIGAGGRQETAPLERTLLVSVTPEIVPGAQVRNRPEELSHPVDEYGSPLSLKPDDKFTPPVVLDRVVPKFDTGRKITGSVGLTCVIASDGKVTNVKVVHSLDPDIDQVAVDAFRQFHFSAALLNGKPAPATYHEEITFGRELSSWEIEEQQLQNKKSKNPPRQVPNPWPPLLFAQGSPL
ncbi:MAG TPA: energy transducer TonB [Blastocatellia bacterium]